MRTHQLRQLSAGLAVMAMALGSQPVAGSDQPPRPTVAVLDFETTPAGTVAPPPHVGRTLADMMLNSLVASGQYRVLDGRWLQVAPMGAPLRFSTEAMRESARAAGVDYLVAGSITRFTSERRRRGTGAGLIVPLIAGVRRQKTELVVGILVRIIDVRNGEIVTTASSHGTSDRKQVRVGALGLFVHGGGGIYSRESLDSRDAQLDEAIRAAVAIAAQGVINAAPRLRGEK